MADSNIKSKTGIKNSLIFSRFSLIHARTVGNIANSVNAIPPSNLPRPPIPPFSLGCCPSNCCFPSGSTGSASVVGGLLVERDKTELKDSLILIKFECISSSILPVPSSEDSGVAFLALCSSTRLNASDLLTMRFLREPSFSWNL